MNCLTHRAVTILSLATLAIAVQVSIVDATPRRHQRRNYNVKSPTAISWRTFGGKRVTKAPGMHGHGHAAPIKSSAVRFGPTKAATVKTPKLSIPKHPGGGKPFVAGRPKHHPIHRPHVHAYGRITVGRHHHTAGLRVVVPAVGAVVALPQATETVVIESPALPAVGEESPWRVQRVLDATRVVVRREGQTQQVRLLGVEPASMRAEENTKHLEKLAAAADVYLVFDDAVAQQDEDGITTAYLFLSEDGSLVNLAMIHDGHALAAAGYEHEYVNLFASAQGAARAESRGFWADVPAPTE